VLSATPIIEFNALVLLEIDVCWRTTTNNMSCKVVLCDTRDTSILIVDTYVTIPVSPKSRYTAVYRSSKNIVRRRRYREYRRYHASRTTRQRAACKPV